MNVFTTGQFALDQSPSRWGVMCDFDGTITRVDVTDWLLSHYGLPGCDELEVAWRNGGIGSRECMGGQIALLDASQEEVDALLDDIEIDPEFVTFVRFLQAQGSPVQIVSDGLDYAINRILHRHGVHGLPVFANRLERVGERRWALHFPYGDPRCIKGAGHCKCATLSEQQRGWRNTLYVGDGASDFCVSGKVDLVLAKGKLIDHCRAQGIAHEAISGFAEALALCRTLFAPAVLAEVATP